jgi:hypothetical protein
MESNIIVAENGNPRIQFFNPQGESFRVFGTNGSGPGQFSRACGLAIDKNGLLLVADSGTSTTLTVLPPLLLLDGFRSPEFPQGVSHFSELLFFCWLVCLLVLTCLFCFRKP